MGLDNSVVIGGKIYCYDAASQRCVEVKLTPIPDSKVPEVAEKLILMRRFDLIERPKNES